MEERNSHILRQFTGYHPDPMARSQPVHKNQMNAGEAEDAGAPTIPPLSRVCTYAHT